MKRYREHQKADWTAFQAEISAFWSQNQVFEHSLREDDRPVKVFYEGPPSANGIPGIHHVMARTIKDLLCRYWTMEGYRVARKSGWDTHGLPVELQVEQKLGLRREDIGTKISIEEFNRNCREDVMKYTGKWEELTRLMGYWIDLEQPYVTYHNDYIESVWNLLKKLFDRGLLYKGYTVQPYSPAAGTGLSSHELNQPGTYRQVKDLSLVAQFRLEDEAAAGLVPKGLLKEGQQVFVLAWTTTPWTLPSNTGLAVGEQIGYVLVPCQNPYTGADQWVILARERFQAYFGTKDTETPPPIAASWLGKDLAGLRYRPLLPYARPSEGDPYRIVLGDFVSTADGTGIVHLAPSFGADDFRVGRAQNLGHLTLVDRTGRFTQEVQDPEFPLAGMPVKEALMPEEERAYWLQKQQTGLSTVIKDLRKVLSADELISLKLKREGLAFRIEKYEHSYPHCWRTDKPILYYPLDSWFVRTTAFKERMIALNKEIVWKPESTGTGRFGNWLENLVDWNLSRSRFWGTPLPVWRTEDGSETLCIGSLEELRLAMEKARAAGCSNPEAVVDLHRPYVDEITLISPQGQPMRRETDLIDVWFDSGAMPYAQHHFPFEGQEEHPESFPADFIAEGVDQTRGWFFTLHALGVMLFDRVAFKAVVSNGLVLDKDGNKMSKRLGNTVDPYLMLGQYGADALRWYLISNAPPWENLKFDVRGVEEVQRKFLGTLFNTYQFWALYANLDDFVPASTLAAGDAASSPSGHSATAEYTEMDRWLHSLLHSLILEVRDAYRQMEPTRAARALQEFTDAHLSNWYVRLSRRRFWKSGHSGDKAAAFETLYQALSTVAHLMAPIAPFYADLLYRDLQGSLSDQKESLRPDSVHLQTMPQANKSLVDPDLEHRMLWAQQVCSLALSLRKKAGIRVRQPLAKMGLMLPPGQVEEGLTSMLDLIRSEVNVHQIIWTGQDDLKIQRRLRPNFRRLGPRYPRIIQKLGWFLEQLESERVEEFVTQGSLTLVIDGENCLLQAEDLDVITLDIPGWQVASEGSLTVALDTTLSPALVREGLARELINRVQKYRKDLGLELSDRIVLYVEAIPEMQEVLAEHGSAIGGEILARDILTLSPDTQPDAVSVDLEGLELTIFVEKVA